MMGVQRIKAVLRNRGLQHAVIHGVRRLLAYREVCRMGPDMIRINPMGAVCNHRCAMCWLQNIPENRKKELINQDKTMGMKATDYARLFREIPWKLREVNVVGGGEPLLHPEITAIMHEIKHCGFVGSLITNGTRLTSSLARDLVRMEWDHLRISVSAGDPETYSRVQGVDLFEQLLENIDTLNQARKTSTGSKMKLSVFHVLYRDNIRTLPAMFRVAERMGADFMEFDPLIPLNPNLLPDAENLKYALESFPDLAAGCRVPSNTSEILRQLTRQQQGQGSPESFRPAARCSVGYDQAFIQADGDVLPCCFSNEIMGNLKEQSFREIWFGSKFETFRRRLMRGRFARYCVDCRCTLPGVLLDQ